MRLTILLLAAYASALGSHLFGAVVVDFEELPVSASGFYNGDIAAGSPFRDNYTVTGSRITFGQTETLQLWSSQGANFNNNYIAAFASWSGWSWSNVTDTTTAGFGNQYASSTGGGSNGAGGVTAGEKYAVSFGNDAFFNVPTGMQLQSVDITNTTYAALSMANGDQVAKKFGGVSGNEADLFQVTLTGYDAPGAGTGSGNAIGSVTVDLADFRFADNSQDFILTDWQAVDLTSLAAASSIGLTYFSTDTGGFGINTPTYAAFDNLTFSAVPEPSTGCLGLIAIGLLLRRRNRVRE